MIVTNNLIKRQTNGDLQERALIYLDNKREHQLKVLIFVFFGFFRKNLVPLLLCLSGVIAFPALTQAKNISPCVEPDRKAELWQPYWQDLFQKEGTPDLSKWQYYQGVSLVTDELEILTTRRKNVRVENGHLILEAHKENYKNMLYTSGKLRSLKHQTYGRWEICAQIPSGRGTWSAFWMLPENQVYGDHYWPDNGEIDFLETVGYRPTINTVSAHTKNHNFLFTHDFGTDTEVPDLMDRFHLIAFEWFPDHLDYFVDNIKYHTVKKTADDWQTWPFNQDFFLIMDLAIGGQWATVQGLDDGMFPRKIEVASVRVFKLKNAATAKLKSKVDKGSYAGHRKSKPDPNGKLFSEKSREAHQSD